jgi:cytochrome oxidase assembly protein ShyY1
VDRGWIPYALQESFLSEDPSTGPVEVTGLVFPLAPGDAAALPAAPRRVEWLRFDPDRGSDVAALQAQLPYPLTPVLLQRGPGAQGELPVGGFEAPRSRVDHRSYAITWFSMGAIALAVWVGIGLKQGRAGPEVNPPRSPDAPAPR